MDERVEIVIGHPDREHVLIRVQGRMHPGRTDYWDGNWLTTPVTIRVGAWEGTLGADLRADELRQFREGLEGIQRTLRGEAVLASLDGWLDLTVKCQPNGALVVEGHADDQPGTGNKLRFALPDFDQSYLPQLIEQLLTCEREFPVLGSPSDR